MMPIFLPPTRADLKLRHYRAYLPGGETVSFTAFDDDEAARIFRDVITMRRVLRRLEAVK